MENIIYEGVPVNYYFFPGDDSYISHGEFRFTNNSDKPVVVRFDNCELMIDGNAKNLGKFFVYLEEVSMIGTITVDANSVARVKITFPFIQVRDFRFQQIAIHSQIAVDGKQYHAASEINIFFEKHSAN